MKIDKRFEIPFICSAGAVPWSKVWKEWRRATEVKPCSNPCLSLSTPAEEIKEIISGAVASQLLDPNPFHKYAFRTAYLPELRFRALGWTCWRRFWLSLWGTRTGLQPIYVFNIQHNTAIVQALCLHFVVIITPSRIASGRPNFFRYYSITLPAEAPSSLF